MLRGLLLGLGLMLAAPAAQASVVVNFSFMLNFLEGETQPYEGSFVLSGDPMHSLVTPAPYDHDMFGYSLDAISDFTPITVGGVTYGRGDITDYTLDRRTETAAVWFDKVPVIGEPLRMSLLLGTTPGGAGLTLGMGACFDVNSCSFLHRAMLSDSSDDSPYTGDLWISVAAVPVPATLPLMAAALAGLGLLARRRHARV